MTAIHPVSAGQLVTSVDRGPDVRGDLDPALRGIWKPWEAKGGHGDGEDMILPTRAGLGLGPASRNGTEDAKPLTCDSTLTR